MNPTIRIDTSGFSRAFAAFRKTSKRDLEVLLREQARGVVRHIIAFTPPSRGKADLTARRRGEVAVISDIARIFSSATPGFYDRFIDFHGGYEAKEDFAHRGAAALGFIYTRALSRWEMEGWHNDRRGNRGRVKAIDRKTKLSASEIADGGANRKRAAQVTTGLRRSDLRALDVGLVKKNDYEWFKKRASERVGLLASGWNRAAERLNYRPPAWIRRHGTQRGKCDVQLSGENMRITLSNKVPFVGSVKDLERRVKQGVAIQTRNMERRTASYLEKAAKRAGFRTR